MKNVKKLSSTSKSRLKTLNKRLWPAKLEYRTDTGKFRFIYRRNGHNKFITLGDDLELCYERALILREEYESKIPTITSRKITLQAWYDEWSAERYPDLAPKTVVDYSMCWDRISGELKGQELARLTKPMIAADLEAIKAETVRDHTSRLISIMLNAAVKAGMLDKSPWKYVVKKRKKVVPVLSTGQIEAVCEVALKNSLRIAGTRPVVQLCFALAGFAGLRTGEIMNTRRGDFDLERRILYVRGSRTKTWGKDGIDLEKGTKTGKPRVVPIPRVAIRFIEPALEGLEPEDRVFPAYRQDLSHRLSVACRTANVPRVSMHELRHVCGSNLMMTGGPAFAQAVLGHEDIGTTVDTYGHLTPIYLQHQMDLAYMDPMLKKMSTLSAQLLEDDRPEVKELAEGMLQLCSTLGREDSNLPQEE